ncbi:hypothetical protein WAI453_000049 [Rhynchosporium graminicola]
MSSIVAMFVGVANAAKFPEVPVTEAVPIESSEREVVCIDTSLETGVEVAFAAVLVLPFPEAGWFEVFLSFPAMTPPIAPPTAPPTAPAMTTITKAKTSRKSLLLILQYRFPATPAPSLELFPWGVTALEYAGRDLKC